MKQNKDFWNGYIACRFSKQFAFKNHKNVWSDKIDNILHRYHAKIIQIPKNFQEYTAPLRDLKQEAENKITDQTISTIHSIDKLLIEWCKHFLNVLSLGNDIAVRANEKFEDGLISYINGIFTIEQEIEMAYQYILMMRIDKPKEDVKD